MVRSRFFLSVIVLSFFASLISLAEIRRFEGPGPVEVQVYADAKPGMGAKLEKVFLQKFYPAISKQAGFKHCDLLRDPDNKGRYILTIAFESEDLRLRWANSDLHQQVWPEMQANLQEDTLKIDAFAMVSK